MKVILFAVAIQLSQAFFLPTIQVGSASDKAPVVFVSTSVISQTTTTFPFCFISPTKSLPACRRKRQANEMNLLLNQDNSQVDPSERQQVETTQAIEIPYEIVRAFFEGSDEVRSSLIEQSEFEVQAQQIRTGPIVGSASAVLNLSTISIASVTTVTARTQTLEISCTVTGISYTPVCSSKA